MTSINNRMGGWCAEVSLTHRVNHKLTIFKFHTVSRKQGGDDSGDGGGDDSGDGGDSGGDGGVTGNGGGENLGSYINLVLAYETM